MRAALSDLSSRDYLAPFHLHRFHFSARVDCFVCGEPSGNCRVSCGYSGFHVVVQHVV